MGLIARDLEAAGIATVCLSSALSITRAVNPPRAVFVDYPLGSTAGPPDRPRVQDEIVGAALRAFEHMKQPGSVETLDVSWDGDDSWKDALLAPPVVPLGVKETGGEEPSLDQRGARQSTPQYQSVEDEAAAARLLTSGGCSTCVFLE